MCTPTTEKTDCIRSRFFELYRFPWVIPFAFVAYLPSSYFLGVGGFFGSGSNMGVIGIECAIALVFWLIAYGVFTKGIRRYESAGN